MSQSKQILKHLQEQGSINPIDVLNKFGCFRLGARIHDLKKCGYQIQTIPTKQNGKRFATYRLGSV